MPRFAAMAVLFAASQLLCLPSQSASAQADPPSRQPPATAPATAKAPASQLAAAEPVADAFPDLSLPAEDDLEALENLVLKAKAARPRLAKHYQAQQTAIRDASKRIMKLFTNKTEARYQQAELDKIASSVALMTTFGEDAKQKTLEQVHQFLKSRKELSLQDIQTGLLATAMLELQPNKKPARDTYQLLYDLLEDDEREEMQSLRLNLEASIRRLDLLGSQFELKDTTLDGHEISIEDFAGKFVVVDFFATWCEPCLAEVPRLQKHFEKYHEKGLEIVGISLDGDADDLKKYLERAKLPWPIIHDDADDPLERWQMKFGVSHLPTVLLLNKEGTVVSLEARGGELDRLMEMLFEAPTPAAPPTEATTAQPAQEQPEPKTESRLTRD